MIEWTVYSESTGRIRMAGQASSDVNAALQAEEGETLLTGAALSDAEWYCPGGVATERPEVVILVDRDSTIAPGAIVAVAEGLPAGTMVRLHWRGGEAEATIDDGVLDVEAVASRVYVIEVNPPWPFRQPPDIIMRVTG